MALKEYIEVRLRFEDLAANSDKFYYMTQISDTEYKCRYGRWGTNGVEKIYPMSNWDSTYKSKIKKGYKVLEERKLYNNTPEVYEGEEYELVD